MSYIFYEHVILHLALVSYIQEMYVIPGAREGFQSSCYDICSNSTKSISHFNTVRFHNVMSVCSILKCLMLFQGFQGLWWTLLTGKVGFTIAYICMLCA